MTFDRLQVGQQTTSTGWTRILLRIQFLDSASPQNLWTHRDLRRMILGVLSNNTISHAVHTFRTARYLRIRHLDRTQHDDDDKTLPVSCGFRDWQRQQHESSILQESRRPACSSIVSRVCNFRDSLRIPVTRPEHFAQPPCRHDVLTGHYCRLCELPHWRSHESGSRSLLSIRGGQSNSNFGENTRALGP